MLGVMPSKYINGCNSLQGAANLELFRKNCHEVLSLNDMLDKQYITDAHFTCYQLTNFPQWPLLNKAILPEIREEGQDIVLAYMAFDWDNPDHGDWTPELLNGFGPLILNCQDPVISSWSAMYSTQHGARLVYTMSCAVPVDEAEKHIAWMLNHFKEQGFGEESGFGSIDMECKDWTRRMRCPQVCRDGEPEINKRSWEQSYYWVDKRDSILNMNLVGKRSTHAIARKTYFIKDKQEMSNFQALADMLHTKDRSTGRLKQTEFYKRAKKVLKDSVYFDVLLNDAPAPWAAGHRNDEINKMLGYITPVLLKQAFASVHQVFALAIQPLLTLEVLPNEDWIKHGWNALLDIYEREVNKLNLEKSIQAEKVCRELDVLDTIVEGVKDWCKAPELFKDEDSAREFVRDNILASTQGFLYALDNTGRYSDFSVNKEQIVARVRKTYLDDIIKTRKMNFNGEEVDVTTSAVINQYSTPVAEVQMRPVGGSGGFIEDINGKFPVLVLSTFCRNDKLIPTFDPYVHEWLKNLFGDKYFEKGCDWIGNALAFEDGLICAISLAGASSAGKKLFTAGLSECLERPHIAGPDALYGQSSIFTKTPFLVVDESWPTYRGEMAPSDKFKSLTGGEGVIVNEKFKPSIKVLCPIRIILTANNTNIIKTLIGGKDMTVEDRVAIGDRLLHIPVSKKAQLFLESIGGRGHTAKTGQRWIRPDSGPEHTDYIVAKHFLYLYKHRTPVNPTQRFLVVGNCAPGASAGEQNVIEKILADNNNTPLVAKAIIGMVDGRGTYNKYIRTDQAQTRLWVTRFGVDKYIKEILEERVSEDSVYSGMLNLLEETEPELIDFVHWYEISLRALVDIATERGIAQTLVRNIYMNKLSLEAAV